MRGTKSERFSSFASACQAGMIKFVRSGFDKETWDKMVYQLTHAPRVEHDDIFDALGDCYRETVNSGSAKFRPKSFGEYMKQGVSSYGKRVRGQELNVRTVRLIRMELSLSKSFLDVDASSQARCWRSQAMVRIWRSSGEPRASVRLH